MAYNEKWIRTCQECMNKQEDIQPQYGVDLKGSYMSRKCKKCKSESLDYGSIKFFNEAGEELILWEDDDGNLTYEKVEN